MHCKDSFHYDAEVTDLIPLCVAPPGSAGGQAWPAGHVRRPAPTRPAGALLGAGVHRLGALCLAHHL